MKKIFKLIAALAVPAAAFVACSKDEGGDGSDLTAEEKALKAAVEEYVPGVIYSIYDKLADSTADLYDQLADLKKGGVDALTDDKIASVCNVFLDARAYWEKSEAFLFGAATAYGIDPHIDSWPLDRKKLAKELSKSNVIADLEEEGAGAVDEVGTANLGFHGIEFILFRDGKPREASAFKSFDDDAELAAYKISGRCELIFAAAVAEDLRNYCWKLQASWNPKDFALGFVYDFDEGITTRRAYVNDVVEIPGEVDSDYTFGENLLASATAGSTYRTWQRAVTTILVSGCSNICSEVANSKIASAYDVNSSDYDGDYIESPYSKKSYLDFYNNIQSIVYSLYGKDGAAAPSSKCIYSVLTRFGYEGAAKLKSALEGAVASLQACLDSGKAFVDEPTAECAGNAIVAINALDVELNKAADWVSGL